MKRQKTITSFFHKSEAGPSQSSEDLQEGSHSRKRPHEDGDTVELQTEQQGGTGGNTEGEDVDMIMTYTKPNQPDPKV